METTNYRKKRQKGDLHIPFSKVQHSINRRAHQGPKSLMSSFNMGFLSIRGTFVY